ncbi:MAG: ATP-binding cassette domain-containing protein, partial [Myxococcota bacterium]
MNEPLVRLRSLTKVYGDGDAAVRALDGIDLSIAEGEFVAVMGASGSGKST